MVNNNINNSAKEKVAQIWGAAWEISKADLIIHILITGINFFMDTECMHCSSG